MKFTTLMRGLAVGFGAFLAVLVAGRDIAVANSAQLNNYLHATSYKLVKDETSGEEVNSEYFAKTYKTVEETKTYVEGVSREAEGEGIVLLENKNQALPLAKGAKISLVGNASVKMNYTTSGSSASTTVSYPNVAETFTSKGYTVNSTLTDFYTNGAGKSGGRKEVALIGQNYETPWSSFDAATIASFDGSEAAIFVLAKNSGEGKDIALAGSDGEDGSYLSISPEQETVLKGLTELKKAGKIKKIVVLLNCSMAPEVDFMFRDGIDVDSLLWIGNVGSQGLYSVCDVLNGTINPSGRAVDTFERDVFASPAVTQWRLSNNKFAQQYTNKTDYNSLGSTQTAYGSYAEGIYVGYRYYETRYEDVVNGTANVGEFKYSDVVGYPFGHGLSYSEFKYSDFKVETQGDNFVATVTVKNVGTVKGKEAVEIYMHKPYTDYDKTNGVEKSAVELVGVNKTKELEAGAEETVTVTIPKEEMKSYDANGAKTYILDQGDYYLTVGKDAHDAINNVLAAQSKKVADGMTADGDSSLAAIAYTCPALDTTTYSKSLETGKEITNQLDFMDMNKYANRGDNAVTYLTRNNWTGTWPTVATSWKLNDAMVADLASHKAIDATGYEMPTYSQSNGLQLINLRSTEENKIAYDDANWDLLLNQMSAAEQAELMTSAGFSTLAVASVGKPATKDNDGPTGLVNTSTGNQIPSKGIIAATYNPELIEKVGDALAEDARAHQNDGKDDPYCSLYAPGINLHRTSFGGRTNEYYSEDAFLTGFAALHEITGMQNKGVIPTLKHFAFNNEETNRNGISIWMNEQEARELNLKPFEMAMRPSMGNGHAIMTSFNRAGCLWTSASENLMININRNEFGFDGYSLTDMAASNAAQYMVYDDGIAAGTDLFLGTGGPNALDEWKDNAKFATRMRESCHRVLYVICNFSAAMNGITSDMRVVPITPWWDVALISCIIAFAVLTAAALAGMVLGMLGIIGPKAKN